VINLVITKNKILMNGEELGQNRKAEVREVQLRLNEVFGLPEYSSYPPEYDILDTGNEKNS
jgi:hypothetical protein